MNVYAVGPLEEKLSDSYWQSRFIMVLLTVFAGLPALTARVLDDPGGEFAQLGVAVLRLAG